MKIALIIMLAAAGGYVLLLITWLNFIAIMRLQKLRQEGRLKGFALFNGRIIAVTGFPLDIIFNHLIGSIIFMELPHEWLFTRRLQRLKRNTGWRGKVADYICENMINTFDEGHC